MRRNTVLALSLVAVASFSLSATSAAWQTRREAASQPQTSKAAALVPAVSEIDIEGLKRLLQRGAKDARPLLVNFWATWCEPCRDEFPDLVQIDKDYKARGLDFVTVSLDDPGDIKTAVPQFLLAARAQMPTYLLNVPDPEPAIKWVDQTWNGSLPATFLFDAQGQIIFKHTGRIKPAELRTAIEKAVTSDR